MTHTMDHPSDLRPIWQSEGLVESFESKPLDGLPLVVRPSGHTSLPRDPNCFLHVIDPVSSLMPSHAFFPKLPREPLVG